MTDILMVKTKDGSWRPADDLSWARAAKFPVGEPCHADIKNPSRRSGRQHAFAFALMKTLFDGQDHYQSFDHFRSVLLIALGYCEVYETKAMGKVPVAKSLAYGKMTADEFGDLVDAILDFAEGMGFDRRELLAHTREAA